MKTNILETFYSHVDDDDWVDGLSLYQAGKVSQLNDYHGLITSTVSPDLRSAVEVRLKIHPNGRYIQWIECTCKKNRTSGQYCEHMAAFMISIDRESPTLLGHLDSKMPLKPPPPTKKAKPKQDDQEKGTPTTEKASQPNSAAATILAHLEGAINKVDILSNSPTLKIKLEIKTGQLTHYKLPLDESADFLQTHTNKRNFSENVKDLKVYSTPVIYGTRIYLTDHEKIVAERVFAIKHNVKSQENAKKYQSKLPITNEKCKFFSDELPKGRIGFYEFIPIKSASKFIGQRFLFLPSRGFWPLPVINPSWQELPLKKIYHEDAAVELIASNFHEYFSLGPIWLSSDLQDPIIKEVEEISQIDVHKVHNGWFFLDPKYAKGKESISMIEMMGHFQKKKRKFLKKGNLWIKVPDFLKEANWDLDETGKYLKVDNVGLMRLRASMGDFDQFVGSKKLLNQLRSQVEFVPEGEIPSLSGSNLNLREYQTIGLRWLWWLYQNKLHGLLADEMGLGKTHQAMALLVAIQQSIKNARFLIICPTTVIDHWEDKISLYADCLNAIKFHGPKRSYQFSNNQSSFTLLTSYGILLRDIKEIATRNWDAIILDEAHFVKNNGTATYKAACRLTGAIKICLSGTPMENNLTELKNIFDFLVPGYLGSDDYFRKNFITTSDQQPNSKIALLKLIHPFKMRRTKNLVLKDLPEKVEDIKHCSLSSEQIKLYREVLSLKAKPLIEQLQDDKAPVPYLHVFATLTLLKQICNHPCLALKSTSYENHQSGKFELLQEILEEALGSGHKIVIYSQYVTMIEIFQKYLSDKQIGHAVLTGKSRHRGKIVSRFQEDPKCQVFCGSLLAGGIGIDLTAASVVIHYDRWWNASKESQATDRVHRIGQNKNVQVLKLVTRGTLEEHIDALIKSKKELFETFMNKDEEIFKSMTRSQLINLLQ